MRRVPIETLLLIVSQVSATGALVAGELKRSPEALIEDLRSDDLNTRREAAYALHHSARDLSEEQARQVVGPLAGALEDRDRQVWYHAVTALARLGPRAEEAAPALLRGLESRSAQVNYRCAYALGQIGKPVVPSLIRLLKEDRDRTRTGAALALYWCGSEAEEAVDDLARALQDDSENVRKYAGQALAAIGEAAVAALIQTAASPRPEVRRASLRAIYRMKPAPKATGETIEKALDDEDALVREMAVRAYAHQPLPAATRIGALTKKLGDSEWRVRRAAVSYLIKMDPLETHVIPQLIESLGADEQEIRHAAAVGLGEIGPKARPALFALKRAAEEAPGTEVAEAARAAAKKIETE